MAFDPFSAIFNLIETGVDKFLPDKMDEADREKLKAEMAKFAVEESRKEGSAFRDFIVQYEGSAKDAGKFITGIRSITRPLLTWGISAAYIYGWVHPDTWTVEQMAVLKPAFLIVLIFWFGDRALQKSGLLEVFRSKK